ncbi:MAG: hypothetical protein DRO06_03745 [Thermoproteota archaeon]|nr:MAG: hypothetical protein DRO06_03745 [Candidatus Korarchaeota archaeon]
MGEPGEEFPEEPEEGGYEELSRAIERLTREIESMAESIARAVEEGVARGLSRSGRPRMITVSPLGVRVEGPERVEIRRGDILRRPVPIRRLDRALYSRIKEIAEETGRTVGEVMNEAMEFYLRHRDLAYLEGLRDRLLTRLQEVGVPGALEDDVREILIREYSERLREVKEEIERLRREARGE